MLQAAQMLQCEAAESRCSQEGSVRFRPDVGHGHESCGGCDTFNVGGQDGLRDQGRVGKIQRTELSRMSGDLGRLLLRFAPACLTFRLAARRITELLSLIRWDEKRPAVLVSARSGLTLNDAELSERMDLGTSEKERNDSVSHRRQLYNDAVSLVKWLMTLIPLSAKHPQKNAGRFVAVVDDCDADLAQWNWYAKVTRHGGNMLVYAVRSYLDSDGMYRRVRMHRLIAERVFGALAPGIEVDHAEPGQYGGLDNRRSNLRLASHRLNIANGRHRVNNTSGFKGVHYVKRIGKWQALIRVDGTRKHLGYFSTPSAAGEAYNVAALAAWGEFAAING